MCEMYKRQTNEISYRTVRKSHRSLTSCWMIVMIVFSQVKPDKEQLSIFSIRHGQMTRETYRRCRHAQCALEKNTQQTHSHHMPTGRQLRTQTL